MAGQLQTTPGALRSYAAWNNIGATPLQFVLDAGNYGMTLHSAAWGTGVTLQRLLPDGTTLVSITPAIVADGMTYLQLPAGQYQLTFGTATGVSGMIEKIDAGRARR